MSAGGRFAQHARLGARCSKAEEAGKHAGLRGHLRPQSRRGAASPAAGPRAGSETPAWWPRRALSGWRTRFALDRQRTWSSVCSAVEGGVGARGGAAAPGRALAPATRASRVNAGPLGRSTLHPAPLQRAHAQRHAFSIGCAAQLQVPSRGGILSAKFMMGLSFFFCDDDERTLGLREGRGAVESSVWVRRGPSVARV